MKFKAGVTVSFVLCNVCMHVCTNKLYVCISIWDCFSLIKLYIILLAYLQRDVISLEIHEISLATCTCMPPIFWFILSGDIFYLFEK